MRIRKFIAVRSPLLDPEFLKSMRAWRRKSKRKYHTLEEFVAARMAREMNRLLRQR